MIDGTQRGLPRGFRDILPTEARELHAIERLLMSLFESHGFVPLELPAVELAAHIPGVDEQRVFRFLDRDGSLVALRPDVTSAVARVAAQRYHGSEATLRLCYFVPVFREEASMGGAEREYDQAGIELIGEGGRRADAEVIALLGAALGACGIGEAEIDVGHAGWLRGYLDQLDGPAAARAADAAGRGDLVELRAIAGAGLRTDQRASFDRGLSHRGPLDEALADPGLPPASRAALEDLAALVPLLDAAGGARVRMDLGLLPTLSYYSGVMFQATAADIGAPLASGGRYDELLPRHGVRRAATGFAITVPHLHRAMVGRGWRPPDERPLVVLTGPDDRVVLRAAAALRARGVAAVIGEVAETAGRSVLRARVRADGTLDMDGSAHDVDGVVALALP